MPSQKQYSLDIELGGKIDPSLARAVGMSEKELKRLQDAINTVNKAVNKQAEAWLNVSPQIDKAHESLKRMAETAAGVFTADALMGAAEGFVDVLRDGLYVTVRIAQQASKAASDWQQLSLGMGNLFRDQAFANQLMGQLQATANLSPFQATDLAGVSRKLAGYGVGENALFDVTKRLGDIATGSGGGREVLDRMALAYGEAVAGEVVTTREINQLTQAGVPIWKELEKLTGKNVLDLRKEIEQHGLKSDWLYKVIQDLTDKGGLFNDAMKNFSETFEGLSTTFEDKTAIILRGLGDVVNEWAGAALKMANDSPLWDQAQTWFHELNAMSQATLGFIQSLPSSELMGKFEPYLTKVQEAFDHFNNWIGSFFTEFHNPATGNIETAVNATGAEQFKKAIDAITNIFAEIADFLTSDAMKSLVKWEGADIADSLKGVFRGLEEIVDVMDDVAQGNWGKLAADIKKYDIDLPNADYSGSDAGKLEYIQRQQEEEQARHNAEIYDQQAQKAHAALQGAMPGDWESRGAGGSWGGASSGPIRGEYYGHNFGEYNRDANYYGNQQLSDNDVAISPDLLAQYPMGSMIDVTQGGKRIGTYRVGDVSYKSPGQPNSRTIEVRDQKLDGDVQIAPHVTINYSPTIHHTGNDANFRQMLREHADEVAEQVRRVFGDDLGRQAVV
jgi:tape measure domain-containing protein